MAVIVKGKVYTTISDAFNSITKSGGIKLDSDMNEDVNFYGNKRITLDLNGFTLTNTSSDVPTISITGGCSVTLTDTSDASTGTVESTAVGKGPVYVQYGSNLIVDAGNYLKNPEGNEYYIIANEGTATLNGGRFVNEQGNASLIECGSPNDNYPWQTQPAKMTINGGEYVSGFIPIKCEPGCTLAINDGSFKGDKQCVLVYGNTTINGGTFQASTRGVYLAGYKGAKGYIEIDGGDFTGAGIPIEIVPTNSEGMEAPQGGRITGGTFLVQPDPQFMAPGYTLITGADGKLTASVSITVPENDDEIGASFIGLRHYIIRRPTMDYAGGIDFPVGIDVTAIAGVAAKGGVMAGLDMANRKIRLYTANGVEASGTLEDVFIVLIGN